jgi:hypothetical protein
MSSGEQFNLYPRHAAGLVNRPHFTASTKMRSARTARLPLLLLIEPNHQDTKAAREPIPKETDERLLQRSFMLHLRCIGRSARACWRASKRSACCTSSINED